MKRDIDLLREILFKLEEQPDPNELLYPEQMERHDPIQVSHHIYLLYDGGLITAIDASAVGQPHYWVAKYLTWEGHEFLEASRNITAWNQVKSMLVETGGGMVFAIVKELLLKRLKDLVLG